MEHANHWLASMGKLGIKNHEKCWKMWIFATNVVFDTNNNQYIPHLVAHPTARKWVITPVISGLTLLIPFITGVIAHLLSGMSHQTVSFL